ncbi:uncharacterized protein LOC123888912 [Trifolium pratense]|uniref:uncharacterized protein LOC123888912 n=1 Tax=Trifolium pratense TaxID=57577 RepID=UPI001E695236|nr:uncharacterized protein LOC123888912 [Trifolium pratense]
MSTTSHSFINCSTLIDVGSVQDIDKSHGSCVHDMVNSINTYHMECDPYNVLGRLPQCFVREFGDLIDTHVILQDPNSNELEVRILKKGSEMYFEQGWMVLRDFYNLWFGAWLKFRYVNPRLLVISLTSRWGIEVPYPLHDPPFKHMLATFGIQPKIDQSTVAGVSSNPIVPTRSFTRSYFKKLTSYDVESGILILPWYGFGEFAFAFTFSHIVLVDHMGCRYPCSLEFSVDDDGELACKVSGYWMEFCKKHHLIQGNRIRFAVNEPALNYVMYVCVYPQLGTETTLSYPLSDGSYLPLYVSQQYFVASS